MKRLLLFAFLLGLSFNLFAQQQGDMMVSGALSWTSQSTKIKSGSTSETYKGTRNFSIIPQFHYFVIDQLSVGGGIGYALQKTPNESNSFDKLGLFVIQPMASYYFSLNEKFYYVPRFAIGFGIGNYKQQMSNDASLDSDAFAFNLGLSLLNFEFRPCENIGIMFSAGELGYQTVTVKADSDNKNTSREFGFNLNAGATIGFNYYF